MTYVDGFSAKALGDAKDDDQAYIDNFKCESTVTKGQVVIFNTHTAGELPSVSTSGEAATNVLGVALKSGAAGETIPVLMKGIVKVRASGAITGGVLIVSGAGGTVVTIGSNTHEKVIGKAVQTFTTDGDDGLVMITLR